MNSVRGRASHAKWLRVCGTASILLLAESTVCASLAQATQVRPMALGSVARLARLTFAGTVESIGYRKAEHWIVTDVRFTSLNFAPGSNGKRELTLTTQGGVLDGQQVFISGMPQFEVGKRYIVLATDTGSLRNLYLPIIGFDQGFFRVTTDEGTERRIVQDAKGRPLVRIQGSHVSVAALGPGAQSGQKIRTAYGVDDRGIEDPEPALEVYPLELDPGTRVTEDEFLRVVVKLSRQAR